MPFVQMADLGADTERAQQSPPADPEYEFLHQAQLRPTAVELTGDALVKGRVRRIVAIQEVELHPSHLHLPGAQPQGIARQLNLQPHPLAV